MKDLRNISLYISDLYEGLLDDLETGMTNMDNYYEEQHIAKWAVGDKYTIKKKKDGYILKGNFKVADIKESLYTGPRIKTVQGNISITNTELSSLEGLFTPDAEIIGSLTIEDNSKLVSLKGCPIIIKGSLTISNNKSLMDIDVAPNVYINAYISRNGKKFKKDELAQKINVYKHIFCNVDNELCVESTINEAFKAPQLKIVADSVKKASKTGGKFSFSNISDIEWDKINASDVTEYDIEDPKGLTVARKYIAGRRGMLAFIDADGDVYAIICGHKVLTLKPKFGKDREKTGQWVPNRLAKLHSYSSGDEWRPTEIIDRFFTHAKETRIETLMIIDYSNVDNTWKIKGERRAARDGALALQRGIERDPSDSYYGTRYYVEVLQSNKNRYKKLLTQIRAHRAALSNNFGIIKTRLDKAFARYTALLEKILKNPSKYDGWDVNWLNDKFSTTYASSKYSATETGLFPAVEQYFIFIIKASKGTNYGNQDIQTQMLKMEDNIQQHLDKVEQVLTEMENK